MGFWDWVGSKIEDQILNKLKEKSTEAIDNSLVPSRLANDVSAELLQKYGAEVFYHDLDSYLSGNNIIVLLFKSLRNQSSTQQIYKQGFIDNNLQKFLGHYSKYLNKPYEQSRLKEAFSLIFDRVSTQVYAVNPSSDLGKLMSSQNSKQEELMACIGQVAGGVTENNELLREIKSILSSRGGADDYSDNTQKTAEITEYSKKIKDIEDNFQSKGKYTEAIAQYTGLLLDVASRLRGQQQSHVDELLCSINCKLALCYTNLGNREDAYRCLGRISPTVANGNRTYHFIRAILPVQFYEEDKYETALSHIEQGIRLGNDHPSDFMMKVYLEALLNKYDCDSSIRALDNNYSKKHDAYVEKDLIGEHYAFKGLVYRLFGEDLSAYAEFELALNNGYDEYVSIFNMACSLYGAATKTVANKSDERLFYPCINVPLMLKAVEALQKLLEKKQVAKCPYADINHRAIALYVSACTFLGIPHDLSPIKEYITPEQDYEELRMLILGSREELTEDVLSLLDYEDAQFYQFRNLIEKNEVSKCKDKIIEALETGDIASVPIIYLLLRCCLATKETKDYWHYRNHELIAGHGNPQSVLMDAFAHEIDQNDAEAKKIVSSVVETTYEYDLLINGLRFFRRNDMDDEAEKLYWKIHSLHLEKKIALKDPDEFYGAMIRFLVDKRDDRVLEVLETAGNSMSVQGNAFCHSIYYGAICDYTKMLESSSTLFACTNDVKHGINKALCQYWLFQYDDAIETCNSLLESKPQEDDTVQIYWMLSDIYLLLKNYDNSFSYALKAHDTKKQNPYDRSHQAFLARALRCGRQEAISEIISYKREHPVVVNWIQEMKLPEKATREEFVSQLTQIIPPDNQAEEREKDIVRAHRAGLVPINSLLEYYGHDWGQFFSFAQKEKLNISFGNAVEQNDVAHTYNGEVVVDDLTIVLLAYFKCLTLLDQVGKVHINYSSVWKLLSYYAAHEYACFDDAINWIKTSQNIVFEADGYVDETSDEVAVFSRNFVACTSIAAKKRIPFLYCDRTPALIKQITEGCSFQDATIISIPALCLSLDQNNQYSQSDLLYSLMKGCSFVSFTAHTMFDQIVNNGFVLTEELLAPFFTCNTDCDMDSFAVVYSGAVHMLKKVNEASAVSLARYVLQDAKRIWNRGSYYRYIAETTHDLDATQRAEQISAYVKKIRHSIMKLFENPDGLFSNELNMLQID